MTANPYLSPSYTSKADALLVATTDALATHATLSARQRRPSLLALLRRPSRTAQRDRLLDRYRWANAGLRERLRVEVTTYDATLTALEQLVDEQARILGHAHPLVTGVRAIVGQARVR